MRARIPFYRDVFHNDVRGFVTRSIKTKYGVCGIILILEEIGYRDTEIVLHIRCSIRLESSQALDEGPGAAGIVAMAA